MIGGIPDEHWQQILFIFRKHSNITEVILYGSRAKGNFRNGSDIDIAIKGHDVQFDQSIRIDMDYDDLYLPWKMDVIIHSSISNKELKTHIDRVGIKLN